MTLAEVQTPALLVDLPTMDANIGKLSSYLAAKAPGIRLRPHAKTHKSPDIARRQLAAGAIGVCCQTVGEVEAMGAAGIPDVLLSNQIASRNNALRLAAAAAAVGIRVSACVDDVAQVKLLSEAAQTRGVMIHVLVELDVGGGRCGVGSTEDALLLATMISQTPGLSFDGLQAYHGRAQHLRSPAERQAAIESACRVTEGAVQVIRQTGLSCRVVTGAGTGTFAAEAASELYTELQCGSYVFMDADYARNQPDESSGAPSFAQSLTILTTVISRPLPDRAICDAGLKAMSLDSGPPSLDRHPGIEFAGSSDEHSKLRVRADLDVRVGDHLQIIPGHCDPTVAMHDWILAHDGRLITDVWPIARGW
jgi:D-serine deaminase-like pyridoxal phosphate-dependent protein